MYIPDSKKQSLCDALHAQILGDHPNGEADLTHTLKKVYEHLQGGYLDDSHVAFLEAAAHERRQRFKAAETSRTHVGGLVGRLMKIKPPPGVVGTGKGGPTISTSRRRVIPEDEQRERGAALCERRRRQKRASIPADIAGFYPFGEQVVLGVVALQHIDHGICALTVKQIARRAGVCTRLVQRALRRARDLCHITARRLPKAASVITIQCPDWLKWFDQPWLKNRKKTLSNQLIKDPPMGERAFAKDLNPGGYEVLDEDMEGEALEATQEAEEPAPPVSAPVTPTSYGHGPTAAPASTQRLPPKPGHPAQLISGGIDAMLQAAIAEVMATAAERGEKVEAEPAPESPTKPALTAKAYASLKRFWKAWPHITELDPQVFPRVFEKPNPWADPWIVEEVRGWLRANCTAQGVDTAFTHYRESGEHRRRIFIGFATSAAQMMFDMEWRGAKLHG